MTHSTGAKDRLDRFKAETFGDENYAREELVAELGSALISSRYGISKQIKDESVAYLQSWLKELKESPDFIKSTLFDVKRASSMIAQSIDGVQERLNEQVDLMDADNDGNTLEVAHVEREPFEVAVADEYVPFRRGR